MNRAVRPLLIAVFLLAEIRAHAKPPATEKPICRSEVVEGKKFEACVFDSSTDDVQLMWKNPDGEPYESVPAVLNQLSREGRTLLLSLAGGMYHSDSTPVGLYIERSHEFRAINTDNGEGNFFYKPNGVLYFGKKGAGILETGEYVKAKLLPEFAVQAGPLLLRNGVLHPKAQNTSEAIEKPRSGVGINSRGQFVFAFSDGTATFYQFALLFRDRLDCANALHLDSTSVSVFAPSLGRSQKWTPIGPILAVTGKIKPG